MPISVDFETFYDEKNGLGIKQQGMDAYVRDPRFDAYMISVCDGSESWAGHIKNFNWDALDGHELLSHNAGFDSRVYGELVKRGKAPQLKIPAWHCTANLSTYLCMRRDLARAVEFLFGMHVDKSVRGSADGKTWEDLSAEDGGKSMIEYARGDARWCWKIWDKYSHLWPTRERRLSDLTIRQCCNGVQIDVEKLDLFMGVAEKMRVQAESVLPWMQEGKKPTSPKAVAEQCRRVGIPCPPVKSRDGEEAYDEWAAEFSPKHQWVKAYTDYRVIHRFIKILETIKTRLREDGVFSFELLYFGAHTGRWAGSGGFNMQNMRKEPLFCDQDGWLITDEPRLKQIADHYAAQKKRKVPWQEQTLPGFCAYALDIRALFVARPGKRLIISDLSQIEPRCLAWIVSDNAMLDRMRRGLSPYQAHAETTMGWSRGDMKELIEQGDSEAKSLYALAKARVLGLGYGCGWKKFITVAYNMAQLDITADDPDFYPAVDDDGNPCLNAEGEPILLSGYGMNSKRIVREYREQNPLIAGKDNDNPGIWAKLDRAFKAAEGEDFELVLPSGRSLRYGEVRRERRAIYDEETGETRYTWAMTALAFDQKVNGVVRKPFYGGLLTENLVQATARDVFGEHLLALDEAGISVLWNVHDEAICEADPSVTAKDVEHIMSKAPEWMPGLPVNAEAHEVPCYKK